MPQRGIICVAPNGGGRCCRKKSVDFLKKKMEKSYTQGDLTVFWEPTLCSHSTTCWKSLPHVFKPRERPWVDLNGAEADAIRAAVRACPSGALSLQAHGEVAAKPVSPAVAALPGVNALPNGPLEVSGHIRIRENGRDVELLGKTYFCRCGASGNKPYCDGSHHRVGFEG